ncbi:MAG: c-type cytochrome [Rhodocyclaceae bacterium]
MAKFVRPALTVAIVVVASALVACSKNESVSEEEKASLIEPVAKIELAGAPAAGAALRTGQQVYEAVCFACHTAGLAGAPKLGDKAAWAPRIAAGYDEVLNIATHGKGGMPPKGGQPDMPDIEFARAVVYLANQGGANFKEPAAPAGDAAAGSAPAAGGQSAAVDGKKIFDTTCTACHSTGAAGAPKVGDKAAWAPRIAQGNDALYHSALDGKNNVMPAKGGNPSLSEAEVKAAVDYMVAQAK